MTKNAEYSARARVKSAVKDQVTRYGGGLDPNVLVAVKGRKYVLYSAITGTKLASGEYDVP